MPIHPYSSVDVPLSLYGKITRTSLCLGLDDLEPFSMVMGTMVTFGHSTLYAGVKRGRCSLQPLEVLRQMGYDQGAMIVTKDSRSRLARDVEARFIETGQDTILEAIRGYFCHLLGGGREVARRGALLGAVH